MSEPLQIALVGATGLVGTRIIEACVGREDVHLVAVARREATLPKGARMEVFVAEPSKWGEVFEAVKPDVLISALGTTFRKADKEEASFRAVDEQLVLETATAAKEAGVARMIAISSVAADPMSKNFYLRVKGEVEKSLSRIGFHRLDIIRPGLLKGPRANDRRAGERAAIVLSPVTDLFLHGQYRKYRSVDAREVAKACLALAKKPTRGRYTHDHDAIMRSAKSLSDIGASL